MDGVAPPGWPRTVRPSSAPGWERSASAWLLDVCPPEYRSYPALRRHVVVLARLAVLHTEASQAAVGRGLSEARVSYAQVLAADLVDTAVETLHHEAARLVVNDERPGWSRTPCGGDGSWRSCRPRTRCPGRQTVNARSPA